MSINIELDYSPFDPTTRKLREYIFRAYMKDHFITAVDLRNGYVLYEGRAFIIANAGIAKRFISQGHKLWAGKVSFQEHNSGNYAVLPQVEV